MVQQLQVRGIFNTEGERAREREEARRRKREREIEIARKSNTAREQE